LAARLAQGGWEVTVLEAAPALHNEGYIRRPVRFGFEAARRMGLMAALRSLNYEFEAVRWVNATGRTSRAFRIACRSRCWMADCSPL